MKSVRVISSKPRLLLAGVAVVSVTLVAVFLPSAASAQQGGIGGLGNGGALHLHLGSTGAAPQDYFGFRAPNGSGYAPTIDPKQSIGTSTGCKLALSPASSLVTLAPGPANANVGFVSDGIGIRTNGEGNGQPCGRIDAGQTLTLDLKMSGKVIDYAELDIELKFGGTVQIAGFLNGSPVGSPQTYMSVGSDSGPDSGDSDNYRVRFPRTGFTTVNRLVFSIVGSTGAASLEGGADGTQPCDTTDPGECGTVGFSLGQTLSTNDSLFHLVNADGFLDCPSGSGPSEASEPNPGVISSTLARQENQIDPVTGQPFPCTPIPFHLDSGVGVALGCNDVSPQCILLQKDILGQQTQFIWTVTWNPESSEYPEAATQFDFDLDGDFQALQQCLADADGDGLPQLPPADPTHPESPSWCVMDTFVDFNPVTGENTVTESYFGGGDPGGKRH